MNKKYLLLGIITMFVLISCSSAFASLSDIDDSIVSYWSFDDEYVIGTTIIDTVLAHNGTNDGSTNTSGFIGEGREFDGTNDVISIGTNVVAFELTNFTIAYWHKPLVRDNDRHAFTNADVADDGGSRTGFCAGVKKSNDGTNPNKDYFNTVADTSSVSQIFGATNSLTTWEFYTATFAGTNGSIYQNGTMVASDGSMQTPTYTGDNQVLIGALYDSAGSGTGYRYKGRLDEVMFFDRSLTEEEVLELYDAMLGGNQYPFFTDVGIPGGTLNISIPQPLDNTQWNISTINFNATVNSTYNFNCSIYINSTLNQTINEYSAGINVSIDFNITFPIDDEESYNYFINCYNHITNENTTTSIFYIDVVSPNIDGTTFDGNKYYSFESNSLTFQVNVSDAYLYSLNITDSDGYSNQTDLIGETSYMFNGTINITDYTVGKHSINVEVCDGHTDKDIGTFINTKNLITKELTYIFDKDYIKIYPKNSYEFTNVKTEKQKDRYTFDYELLNIPNKLKDYVFYVESSEYIDIVQDNKYAGHLIVPSLKKWIDFEIPTKDKLTYKVKRITDNKVEITIRGFKEKKIKFNSIGSLNCNNLTYYWNNIDVDYIYPNPVFEKTEQTYNFNITWGNFSDLGIFPSVDSFSGNLTWNGTSYSATKTSGAIGNNLWNYFEYTLTTPDISTMINITINWDIKPYPSSIFGGLGYRGLLYDGWNILSNQTQIVLPILFDNCSTYTFPAINFTIMNDYNNTNITGDAAGYFKVWIDDEDNFQEFNLTWDSVSEFSLCIYNSSTNYTFYSQMEYESTGYNKKTYYFVNATLDNETDLVNLYLTPNSTLVTFTVTDQDDNDIQNAYIHVLKYSLPTNSYTTNEILRTDEFGESIGSIVLTNQWYKFLIVYNGITYLETEPVKITSTTRNFRINLLTDFSSFYDIVNEITTSLTFTNSTKNFAYTFINPTGNSVEACLNVTKRSAYGDFYIGGSCSTAASGTLLVNIGNVTDGLYIASGTIHINPFFLTDVLSVNYDLGYKTLGKDGIFFSFLLRVVFAMIGIWNPIVAIVLVGLVDVVMVSMGLFYMTWEVMVVYLLLIGLTIYRLNRK